MVMFDYDKACDGQPFNGLEWNLARTHTHTHEYSNNGANNGQVQKQDRMPCQSKYQIFYSV